MVDDEAAGGAEGGDFRDKAPASVVVVVAARRTTWRDVTRTVQ
jgi:hypothetical protein